jgi:diaminopimelate decarboxylase
MDYFEYKNGALFAESVSVADIAKAVGTPCYIYSKSTIVRHWRAFDDALGQYPHLVCYAVKANSNLAVLQTMARLGSGFDIVSGGELYRVLKAGGDASKVVFSGVGKTEAEIRYALEANIMCFNVESWPELERIDAIAGAMKRKAPIAFRVNPDVDAKTHPYISTGLKSNKFGIESTKALEFYRRASELPNIQIHGVACHIGSQLTELSPFINALDRVLQLVDELKKAGIDIHHLDLGGGLGVRYRDEEPPLPSDYMSAVIARMGKRNISLHFEPGRAIVANAGILVTRVEYLKHAQAKNFAVVDAAMNDLIRPALYSAWQAIIPIEPRERGDQAETLYDVVGPVCETGDFLGKERLLRVREGDLLAIRSAGAYGFTMSSNYNTRPRVAEVMVDGDQFFTVRRRETLDELMQNESLLPPA